MRVLDATCDPFKRPQRSVLPWVGWYRTGRGRRWQVVVQADTERECWRLLDNYRDPRSAECERCVLPQGETPPRRNHVEECITVRERRRRRFGRR